MKRKLIALRIDRDLLDKLAKIGQREDRTTSYLIRKAVKQFVEKEGQHARTRHSSHTR